MDIEINIIYRWMRNKFNISKIILYIHVKKKNLIHMSRNEVCKIFMLSKIVFHFIRKFIIRIALAKFSVHFYFLQDQQRRIVSRISYSLWKRGGEFSTSRGGDGWIFISPIERHVISLFSLHWWIRLPKAADGANHEFPFSAYRITDGGSVRSLLNPFYAANFW